MNGCDTAFRAELSLDYWVPYKYQNNMFTNEFYDGYPEAELQRYLSEYGSLVAEGLAAKP